MAEHDTPCALLNELDRRVSALELKSDGIIEKINKIGMDVMEIKTQMKFFLYISGAMFVVALGSLAKAVWG
jgi:hypothetical protein